MRTEPTSTRAQQRWDALRARLRIARLEQGVSLTELGSAVVGRAGTRVGSGLSRVERGERTPQVDSVIRHAHALGLEVAVVDPRAAWLIDLSPDELQTIVRAAQWAARHPLPFQGRLLAILEKIAPGLVRAA